MIIPTNTLLSTVGQALRGAAEAKVSGGPSGQADGRALVSDVARPADFVPVLRGDARGARSLLDGVQFVFGASAGAATAPAAAPYAGPPILGTFQAARADARYEAMNGGDKETFDWLVGRAKSPEEQAYLKKALAAGHGIETIETFADQIRGQSPAWLHANLRPTADANGGAGLAQQWDCSCAPTTAEVVRGEMDPVYTLATRLKNKDVTRVDPEPFKLDPRDPKGSVVDPYLRYKNGEQRGNYDVAVEQEKILEANDGKATERGHAGGAGMQTDDALNTMSAWTGVKYAKHEVKAEIGDAASWYAKAYNAGADTGLKAAFGKLDADLARGIPCALGITDANDKGGHAIAVTGVMNNPDKTYVIHDPWAGQTVYVKASDLEKGHVVPTIAGWDRVRAVYTSEAP